MTNPSTEQIEAAAKAIRERSTWPSMHWPDIQGVNHLDTSSALARAALVAAAGAALPATSTITEDQLRSLEMTAGSHGMRNALEAVGITVGEPVRIPDRLEVDEAKLAEAIGWEAPGWDSRKELASLFQDHCAIPEEMALESIYPALIAVAGYGYELAREHVLAAAAEQLRGGGR